MSQAEVASALEAARSGVALFPLRDRGLLEVRGEDRFRWLDGMVSGDVKALEAAGPGAGCPALLLTPQGRIISDLQVLNWPEAIWLELPVEAAAPVRERLDRYVIADDVELRDRSAEIARVGLEGPAVEALVRAASDDAGFELPARDAGCGLRLAGVELRAAAFGWSGGPALQLFLPSEPASGGGSSCEAVVREALITAGVGLGLMEGSAEELDCLRIEAGVPRLGRDLDESVLPAEARLERAVSVTKGCYTGQEVVARMRSRDRTSHLLVGLRLAEAGSLPVEGAALHEGERKVGELTSVVRSPRLGIIGLGFVASSCTAPGTRLEVRGEGAPQLASVAALPFTTEAA